jgi:preprotein translocase subunit YajC
MNYYVIIPFGVAIIFLIIFLIRKNQKDEEDYEKFSNNDFTKKPEEEFD